MKDKSTQKQVIYLEINKENKNYYLKFKIFNLLMINYMINLWVSDHQLIKWIIMKVTKENSNKWS